METTIYRKRTNNGGYRHFDSFAFKYWKRSTLRSILTLICSTKELLERKLDRIKRKCFEINVYPKWIVNQSKEKCKLLNEENHKIIATNIGNNTVTTTIHMLFLPYKIGNRKTQKIIKHVKKVLPENYLWQHTYGSKNLDSFFNIKYQTKLEHMNNLNYLVKCLGEATRTINNKKSHMSIHALPSIHVSLSWIEYKILGKGFLNNRVKRKILEILLMKPYQTTVKTQESSKALELFHKLLRTIYE